MNFCIVDTVAFKNEPCKPRLTVVEVPQPRSISTIHYPYYVQVHRCGGGCGALQFVSKCAPKSK